MIHSQSIDQSVRFNYSLSSKIAARSTKMPTSIPGNYKYKGKGKGPSLIQHHEPQTAAAATLCVTDREGVHCAAYRPQAKPRAHGTLTSRPNSHTQSTSAI